MPHLPTKPAIKSQPDWPGLWFELMESDYGEHIGVRFGLRRVGAQTPEWHFLPHSSYDGIGGFAHFLRSQGLADAARTLPILREPRAPGFWPRLRTLSGFLARKPARAAAWKRLDPAWAAHGLTPERKIPTALAAECLGVERTSRLSAQARSQGVSLNSLLLHGLARAASGELAAGPALWAVPVNMRGPAQGPEDTGNFASYVQLDISPLHQPAEIHQMIREALRRRDHWGAWGGINAGRVVGHGGVRRMLRHDRKIGRSWVGAFSNIGAWDGLGEAEWFFCPPVPSTSPFGAGAVICDGRLSLTLQAHPAIASDPTWARQMLERWLGELGTA